MKPMASAEKELDFWEHVNEIRKRLLISVLALLVATVLSFIFAERVIKYLAVPVGGIERLVSIEVTENVGVFMQVSLLCGFILAMPVILFQVVAFILPGLSKTEARWLFTAMPFVFILFSAGVLFSYFVMLPSALPFLINFMGVETTPRLRNYYSFVINLMFWTGMSFQIPIVSFILAKIKLITYQMLLKQWRIALIVIAVLAAFITPTPDPVNMLLLMIPLFILFWLSILLAYLAR